MLYHTVCLKMLLFFKTNVTLHGLGRIKDWDNLSQIYRDVQLENLTNIELSSNEYIQIQFNSNSKVFLLDQKIKIHILCYK